MLLACRITRGTAIHCPAHKYVPEIAWVTSAMTATAFTVNPPVPTEDTVGNQDAPAVEATGVTPQNGAVVYVDLNVIVAAVHSANSVHVRLAFVIEPVSK